MSPVIKVRQATAHDIYFISAGFHAAMLIDSPSAERINTFAEKVCAQPGVLYSPDNTLIAELDGTPVGMLTAYDGARYHDMRLRTFAIIKEVLGLEFPDMEDETRPGEYYLDSAAVLPECRGKGVGTLLLRRGIAEGHHRGLTTTLAVDPVNDKAQKLYESLGFRRNGDLFIFGHTYWRMEHPLNDNSDLRE